MMDFFSSPEFASQASALGQVLAIDLVLAGDNAVAVGLAAAALAPEQRRKAILWGLGAAVVLRIGFALITVQLLAIVGLLLAGGLLLLWVCWKMWRELQESKTHDQAEGAIEMAEALAAHDGGGHTPEELGIKRKSFGAAMVQIIIADVTMSLDNVLAVAGAAHQHPWIMVFGLVLSIALMGIAATMIAKLLNRHRWIGYLGLLIVLYVALHMCWDGYRSIVVNQGYTDEHNRLMFIDQLDISAEEKAHHLKNVKGLPVELPAELPQLPMGDTPKDDAAEKAAPAT